MAENDSTGSENAPLHVLDLPQLYTHPPASVLLESLANLTLKPATWSVGVKTEDAGPDDAVLIADHGIPNYLTSIVISRLQWIEEDLHEAIWEAASTRLCERAGRAAQPTMSRIFKIPRDTSGKWTLEIELVEPTLTGDNVGHKTWLSAYLLARHLPVMIEKLHPHPHPSVQSLIPNPSRPMRILELGSGTGLVGITAAALLPHAHVRLTDLPEIVGNLEHNVRANAHLFDPSNLPTVNVHDWSLPRYAYPKNPYDLILVADPLYSRDHPAWLASTIFYMLSKDKDARVALEIPMREAYKAEFEELKSRLVELGLRLKHSHMDLGTEDWPAAEGQEIVGVVAWWGVYEWADRVTTTSPT